MDRRKSSREEAGAVLRLHFPTPLLLLCALALDMKQESFSLLPNVYSQALESHIKYHHGSPPSS